MIRAIQGNRKINVISSPHAAAIESLSPIRGLSLALLRGRFQLQSRCAAHPSHLKQQPARGKQQQPSVAGAGVECGMGRRRACLGQRAAAERHRPPPPAIRPDAADATWVQFLCTSVLQYKLHPYCSLFVSLLVVMLYRANPCSATAARYCGSATEPDFSAGLHCCDAVCCLLQVLLHRFSVPVLRPSRRSIK
jgi:hypothetical protein